MLDNNLFISAKILKALSSYQIVFLDSSGNDHILVKDKNRREARSYKSLDRLVAAMIEAGFRGDFCMKV